VLRNPARTQSPETLAVTKQSIMLEQIGIDIQIKKDIIKHLLSGIFKGCRIHYFDQEVTWEIENEDQVDNNSICFSLIRNKSEFPIKIEITRTPDKNNEEREQYLAKIISDKLNCKTITNYKEQDKPMDYPSDSIIFEKGHAYFANDSNTMWADGEGGEVEIVREIDFVNYKFDDKGNLVNGSS
jgi:glucan-binding YG repeat protein